MLSIDLLRKTLESSITETELSWLLSRLTETNNNYFKFQSVFVEVPRHIRRSNIIIPPSIKREFQKIHRFCIEGLNTQQLSRIFILLHLDHSNVEEYKKTLHTLFEMADVNELVTLCSGLPFFHYPENWLVRAKDAVRSNIGVVFDSIAFNNSYPFRYFEESAWNQLVLKTIFNEKEIRKIYGLNARANKELAYMITDFANERRAAGRTVPSNIWELVEPFMDEHLMENIRKIFYNETQIKLMGKYSGFEPAKQLLDSNINCKLKEKVILKENERSASASFALGGK